MTKKQKINKKIHSFFGKIVTMIDKLFVPKNRHLVRMG